MELLGNQIRKKIGLSSSQIKWIALFFMTVDHIGIFFYRMPIVTEYYQVFRAIGRIAAPLFLFMTVEGARHTRSKIKYAIRLYIASIVMQFGNYYLGRGVVHANIFQTLFYVVLYISIIDMVCEGMKCDSYKKIISGMSMLLGTVLCFALQMWAYEWTNMSSGAQGIFKFVVDTFFPNPFAVEYSIVFILMGVVAYYLKNIDRVCVFFLFCCILSYIGIGHIPQSTYIRCYVMFTPLQFWMFLALPILFLYNGEKGKGNKWAFYLYYPIHQYAFAALAAWLVSIKL